MKFLGSLLLTTKQHDGHASTNMINLKQYDLQDLMSVQVRRGGVSKVHDRRMHVHDPAAHRHNLISRIAVDVHFCQWDHLPHA